MKKLFAWLRSKICENNTTNTTPAQDEEAMDTQDAPNGEFHKLVDELVNGAKMPTPPYEVPLPVKLGVSDYVKSYVEPKKSVQPIGEPMYLLSKRDINHIITHAIAAVEININTKGKAQ